MELGKSSVPPPPFSRQMANCSRDLNGLTKVSEWRGTFARTILLSTYVELNLRLTLFDE